MASKPSSQLKTSHVYEYNMEFGKMTDFSGFAMPLWYRGIVEEHLAVRNNAGLFDVSHMGRVVISGKESANLIDEIIPTSVSKSRTGGGFYSALLNEKGGIVDDAILMRLEDSRFMLVVNAANRSKDFEWMLKIASNFDADVEDVSDEMGLVAIQGPKSVSILERLTDTRVGDLRRFAFCQTKVDGVECFVSRTGYTGEDGFEISILDSPVDEPVKTLKVWNSLLGKGEDEELLPCGLGARDTLRVEAGLCLYGNDIDETTSPIEADLGWIVSFEKPTFIGKRILQEQQKDGVVRKRAGFTLRQGIPRHGYSIVSDDGSEEGSVTSGSFSPILKKGIGMGYVPTEKSLPGSEIVVDARGHRQLGKVTQMPIYDTTKYGRRRRNPQLTLKQ
jgi:aminomethyltransferase